jgi:hypothetical protein
VISLTKLENKRIPGSNHPPFDSSITFPIKFHAINSEIVVVQND